MKKHNFTLTLLKNLPTRLSSPLLVFDSKTDDDSKLIVIEGVVKNEGALTIVLKKISSSSYQINSVTSIGGRDAKQIWSYITEGLIRYADKEKTLSLSENLIVSVDKHQGFVANIKHYLETGKIENSDEDISGLGEKKMRDTNLKQRQFLQNGKSPILNSKTKVGQKCGNANNIKEKYDEVAPSQIVSLSDVLDMNFETYKLTGRFSKVLGEPYKPFYVMIYGSPYNGKSSVALLFVDDLMKLLGLKALYVMNEEGVKAGLQEKVLRLKITSPIDVVEDYMPEKFKGYDVVALDSIQTCNLTPPDLSALKKRYPLTSFILVSKANKDGTFKGSSDWEHDVDAMLEVKDKHIIVGKNRFPNATENTLKAF